MSGGGERIPGMCGEEQETTGEDVSHPPGGAVRGTLPTSKTIRDITFSGRKAFQNCIVF